MKTLRLVLVLFLFTYLGFMIGHFATYEAYAPKPKPVSVEVVKPLTDWNKFYTNLKNDKIQYIVVGIKPEPNDDIVSEYTLFFADGWRLFEIGHGGLGGCGGKREVYYHVQSVQFLKQHLYEVPSDKAKFVAIGNGKLNIVEVRFKYKGEDEQ